MKAKKWLIGLLAVLCVVLVLTAVACRPEETPPVEVVEGPETGVYYYDDGETNEYVISLYGGDKVAFIVADANKGGGYTLEGETLTFIFGEDDSLTAKLVSDELTVTYNSSEMKFLKKINYTVTYNSKGGSAVNAATVVNGKTVSKPADPTYNGHVFLGWYEDEAYTSPFAFGTKSVKADTTLYAQWAPFTAGQAEYTVDFNLNYDGAPALDSVKTIGGKLYNVAKPVRSGYTFVGWYVSMFEDASKLTYAYTAETSFVEDTTLYAVWSQAPSGSKLAAPEVSVTDSATTWNSVGSDCTYDVTVSGPNGYNRADTGLSTTIYSHSFSALPAGDYVITVTAKASNAANNSETTVRYYKNKALDRVSGLRVIEPRVLVFDGVENAEKYLITVDCGNPEHDHAQLDNGKSTNFNFINCAMQEGGIVFHVTAVAAGYASSVSKEFVYDKTLSQVSGLTVDESTQLIKWYPVSDATNYVVTVNGHSEDIGSATSYSIKNLDAGEIAISVVAKTKGYNASKASTYTYNKTALATPNGVKIVGTTVTWNEVSGATGYTIRIGSTEIPVNGTSFDLVGNIDAWRLGNQYSLSIRARGASANSLWTDAIDVSYYAMSATLAYGNGELSWIRVVGAEQYEVKVNGVVTTVQDGSNSIKVALTQAGNNQLAVRYFDGDGYSEWVTMDVYAYTVSFDTRGGVGVQSVYVAYGDEINLPESTRTGYDFTGWYNEPSGAAGNANKFADETFTSRGDIGLYANWSPKTYTVTYEYGIDNVSGLPTTADVQFNRAFKFDVPQNPAEQTKMFAGWYSQPNGAGTNYTDEFGASVAAWPLAGDATVYAYWAEVLSYNLLNDGTYSVSKGPGVNLVTSIVIPEKYDNIAVTVVEGYGFKDCFNLTTISIPDTINLIEQRTAFYRCNKLASVVIYHVEGNNDVVYESHDGVLLYQNETADRKEIVFVPAAKSGALEIKDGVQVIPNGAFENANITSVIIPNSVTTIELKAFSSCANLASVEFKTGNDDKGLTIESRAFYNCYKLKEINLPVRTSSVSFDRLEGSFVGTPLEKINVADGCANYASVDGVLTTQEKKEIILFPSGRTGTYTIPAGITSIGTDAFADSVLDEVIIPEYVSTIRADAFKAMKKLSKVTFKAATGDSPYGNQTIGDGAFDGNGNISLTEVIFEEGSKVVSIGSQAFANNPNLETIELPASLATLGNKAFYRDYSLKTVRFDEDGVALTIEGNAFQDCTDLQEVYLHAKVVNFAVNEAFQGCNALERIYVPEGNDYFRDQDGVLYDKNITTILFFPKAREGEVSLPATVTTIPANVFEHADHITKVTIGKNVTGIGQYAFAYCAELSELIFEGGGTETLSIDSMAFIMCNKLTSVELPNRIETLNNIFASCANMSSVNIPDSVVTLNGSFSGLPITTITIPASVRTIGSYTFNGTKLTSIFIPKTVTSFGTQNVFADCEELVTITLEEGIAITTIPGTFASSCVALKSISIPNTVTSIGNSAFKNCTSLETVTFQKGGTEDLNIGGTSGAQMSFSGCTSLQSIELPARLTQIGPRAFQDCSALKTVTFETGSRLTQIDANAFENCVLLENIELPDVLETISSAAFKNTGLKSITVPAVNSIADNIFADCAALTTVTFETGTAEDVAMSDNVFLNCVELTTVTLPNNLKDFNPSAFVGCAKLTAINLTSDKYNIASGVVFEGSEIVYAALGLTGSYEVPATVTKIQNNAFEGNSLTSVTFAENSALTTIGDYAFGNSKFDAIELPATLTSLGVGAFKDCAALETVTFNAGQSLVIHDGAFYGCTALQSVTLPANLVSLGDEDGSNSGVFQNSGVKSVTFDGTSTLTTIAHDAFRNAPLASFQVPASVTKIGDNAFASCEELATFTFATNIALETLGSGAFQNCTALTAIVLPEGIEIIGDSTFLNCEKLATVSIPASVTSIDSNAFKGASLQTSITFADNSNLKTIGNEAFANSGLSSIALPDKVDTLGDGAFRNSESLIRVTLSVEIANINFAADVNPFQGCDRLEDMLVTTGNLNYNSDNGVLFTKNGVLAYYPLGKTATTYDVPEDTTAIGNYAFVNNTRIKTINIPGSVSEVGEYAFSNTVLQKVNFGSGNGLSVKKGAFAGITSASLEVTFPIALTGLGANVFDGSTALKTVTFNADTVNTFTQIPEAAFRNCVNLESIVLPNSVTTISNNAFSGCSALKQVTTPNKLESIGDSAFKGTAIETITIPATVTHIGKYAFENCRSLVSFTVPNQVDVINEGTFRNCTSLQDIVIHDGITSIYAKAFAGCTDIARLVLPDAITTVGAAAFTGVGNVVFPSSLEYTVFEGAVYDKDMTTLKFITSATGAFVIPEGVTTIDPNAFAGTEITEVTIPASVTTLSANAFAMASMIESIVFEERTQSFEVGAYAFDGTTSLKSLVLPMVSKLTNNGYAFQNSGVEDLTLIGEGLNIGQNAVKAPHLKNLYILGTVPTIQKQAFRNCPELEYVEFADTVTVKLNVQVFQECPLLKSITLPSGVTSSYSGSTTKIVNSFSDSGIEEIILAEGYTEIPSGAFRCKNNGDTSIKRVVLPSTITSIGANAFAFCNGIESIVIPESVTSVSASAFSGWTADQTIYALYTDEVPTYSGGCKAVIKLSLDD